MSEKSHRRKSKPQAGGVDRRFQVMNLSVDRHDASTHFEILADMSCYSLR